jgi:hypothetical protein
VSLQAETLTRDRVTDVEQVRVVKGQWDVTARWIPFPKVCVDRDARIGWRRRNIKGTLPTMMVAPLW